MKKPIILGGVVFTFFSYFASFVGPANAGDATLTLDDNAGSSSFVVQDVDKTNQFKVNSDGQGYFAGNVGIGTTNPTEDLHVAASTGQANIAVDALSTSVSSSFRLLRAGALKGYFYLNNAADDNVYFGTPTKDPAVTFASTGNVGIGTTNPGSKLTVAGTIESTSGGVKFPDGTSQTTAATSATTLKTYDSGWFAVSQNTTYSKTHNLGTTKAIAMLYVSPNNNNTGIVGGGFMHYIANHNNSTCMTALTTTTINIRTSSWIMDQLDENGNAYYITSGYARIVVLALE